MTRTAPRPNTLHRKPTRPARASPPTPRPTEPHRSGTLAGKEEPSRLDEERDRPSPIHGREPGHSRLDPSRGKRSGTHSGERGSATVLAAGIAAALVVTAVAFAAIGQAGAARHRAQGAADAAALAGAARVLLGEGEACAAARAMIDRGSAELVRCDVNGLEVTVQVDETPTGISAAFGPARAISRAGPVMAE